MSHPRAAALPALLASALLFTAACYAPAPGCGPGAEGPEGEIVLSVLFAGASGDAVSLNIDSRGRSDFIPKHTAWALRTGRVCRTLPPEDFRAVERAWDGAGEGRAELPRRPPRPLLLVTRGVGSGAEYHLVTSDQPVGPDLERALRVTFDALLQAYGERLASELRAAGWGEWAEPTPASSPDS